jgi:hypothetical protein
VIQLASNVSWPTAQIAPQRLSVSHVWLDIPLMEEPVPSVQFLTVQLVILLLQSVLHASLVTPLVMEFASSVMSLDVPSAILSITVKTAATTQSTLMPDQHAMSVI